MFKRGLRLISAYELIKSDDCDELKVALERGTNKINLEPILHFACRHNAIKIVSMLLATTNVDVSYENSISIRSACDNDNNEIAKLLLSHPKINPCVFDNYLLKTACSNGNRELVSLLLKDGRVSPSNHNCTAFDISLKCADIEIIKLLLNDKRIYTHSRFNILYEVIKHKNYFKLGEETIIEDIIYTIACKLARFSLELTF
jgi:ankyrin repeat protein